MIDKEKIPIGSVPIFCKECLHSDGWNLHEAVTDIGRPKERYYASCRKCGFVLPLKPHLSGGKR